MPALKLLVGERLYGETEKAVQACNDYLRLGPGRSLTKLSEKYAEQHRSEPPTKSVSTLKKWSSVFNWPERAMFYDGEEERRKNEELEAALKEQRQEQLRSGLALDYERIRTLKNLTDTLLTELYSEDGSLNREALWLPDVKQIGSGDGAERVDLVRFNAGLLAQLRGLLEDLAKETGGRRTNTQSISIDVTALTDEQLARIAAGEDPLVVISTSGKG